MQCEDLDALFNPEFYSGEWHNGERVMELWVREMSARYSILEIGDFRWAFNSVTRIGIVLNGLCYNSRNGVRRKWKTQRTVEIRSLVDENRYYRGFHFIRQAISRFFSEKPDYALLVDLVDTSHNAVFFVYKRNGAYNFILFNPNWNEIFSQAIVFVTKMSPTLHGFYSLNRFESNPDDRCRKYAYDFMRSVIAGELHPIVERKTHWYCLKRRKRIHNRLTHEDDLFFYPTSNEVVVHGINERGEPCPFVSKEYDRGCNGCNYKSLAVDRYKCFCSLCEGDEATSPMYEPL